MGLARRHIPNRLKMYRIKAGYTQREVAQILGYKSASCITSWENGLSFPTMLNVLKLSILYATLCSQLYFDQHQVLRKELSQKRSEVITKRNKQTTKRKLK